ncbi:MAG: hypothetical protein GXO19_04290 [Epsilonproteobacteria bacterium]|nr:hypothetical protein [Campylobacterota bacterium]NPA56941.1 hypothetical protein [Campylobacterota bacterium]
MRYFISLAVALPLMAGTIDYYYHKLFSFVSDTLRSIDMMLSDSNESLKQKFSIRSSVDTIMESREAVRFKFNIRAHISLPRTQKRLNLFFQEYRRSENIDDETQRDLDKSVKDRSFLVGIQYLTFKHLSYRAGVRFHGISPDPFVSAAWENTFYLTDNSWIYYGDKIFYYLDRHLDNKLFASYQQRVDEQTVFSFDNVYRYQEYLKEHQYTHRLTWYRSMGRYEFISPKAMIYSTQNEDHGYRLNYYYVGIAYHDRIFRDWLFYEIEPGLIWRDEYDFKPGFRWLFRFGISLERN